MSAPHLGIDDEDFSIDLVPAIEKSFGIRFEQTDFEGLSTYGELCTVVQSKLPLANTSDCTSQQAFYKLRLALQKHTPAATIEPTTSLVAILPTQWAQRRQTVQAIERSLDMNLNILGLPSLVENVCLVLVFVSILGLPIAVIIGYSTGALGCLACFTTAIISMNLANRLGATIKYGTVSELVNAMSFRFYKQARRNPNTINKKEVISYLDALVSHYSGIDSGELKPDAVLR